MKHPVVLSLFAFVACAAEKPAPTPDIGPVAVPPGNTLIFEGHAEGAQVYRCVETDGRLDWKLDHPDAQVTSTTGQTLKHAAGPSWEASDGSRIVGEVKARRDADQATIPWLLLSVKSATGEGLLSRARWIQRLDTSGGKAPAGGCDPAHAGAEARVPYSAVYRIWGA